MYKIFKSHPLIVSAVFYASFLFYFSCAVWLWLNPFSSAGGNKLILDIEYFGPPEHDLLELYLNDQGMPNMPYRIKTQSPARRVISIDILDTQLTKIRLDPCSTLGREFKIHAMTIQKNGNHAESRSDIDIDDKERVNILDIARLPDGRMRATGNDPVLKLSLAENLPEIQGMNVSVTDIFSCSVILIMVLLWLTLVHLWKRRAFEEQEENKPCRSIFLPFTRTQMLIAALVCVISFLFLLVYKPSYTDAFITVHGLLPETQNIRLFWDSGHGFSHSESVGRTIDSGTAHFPLPRIRVDQVTFDKPLPSTASVFLSVGTKMKALQPGIGQEGIISLSRADRSQWNLAQVFVQIVAAVVISLCILSAISLFRRRSDLAQWIACNHRYVFFIVFFFSLPFFLFWLLGQWPGAMTYDSVYIWNVTKTFSFTADHPALNPLFFLFAQQFYDSPATVALIQILLFAGLLAYIFHFLYCCKLPLILLACCAVPPLIAVPIGLYNIMLWKDVPFMLSIVFWGFFLYKQYLIRQTVGLKLQKAGWELVFLGVSLLGFLFRHGGEVCIFVIVLCLLASRIFEWKTTARLSVICCAVFLFFTQLVPLALRENRESLPFYSAYSVLNPMGALYVNGYYTPTRAEDANALETFIPSVDNLRAYFPCYVYPIANKGVCSAISSHDAARIGKAYFQAVLLNPGVFLADRIAVFFSALNEMRIGIYAMTYSNMLRTSDLAVSYPERNIQYLQAAAIMPRLAELQDNLVVKSHRVSTLFHDKHLIWNATLQFFLLISVLLLGRWLPASALYSLFILSFSTVVFLTVCVNQFRYIYFIYVGGLFIFPVVLAEIVQIRRLKTDPHNDCLLILSNVQSSGSKTNSLIRK